MLRVQKREQSDERILLAAAKVFGELGYHQATLSKIGEVAGVSQGLVSQRYGTKENLLIEVFDQTHILSFYDESNRHMPQAFYVLLDNLKREVIEEPDWFRFLSTIHTGKNSPASFEARTKEQFNLTPLRYAIEEAQQQNDLPAGDPWDIFRVFFRNATNLISWYHEFGLPMPDNSYFLYAIQYNRRQRENEQALQNQKYQIQTLQAQRAALFAAVADIYPLIVFSNLSEDRYTLMEHADFPVALQNESGVYGDLVKAGASVIPNEVHREQFQRLFDRENVIRAYKSGKKQLCLRHFLKGNDGTVHWTETRMIFKGCECGALHSVTLARRIDDEMERLRSYGEALQKAELASSAKTRFLSNLSHDIRTPMNHIMGFTSLLTSHAHMPEKIKNYAEKMTVSEKELMDLLATALEAANLTEYSIGTETRINIDESIAGILSNASKLAGIRGIRLCHRISELRDDYIYTDEILLQRILMSLTLKAINDSVSGDSILFELKQLDDCGDGKVHLCFTVHDNGVSLNGDMINRITEDAEKIDGIALNIIQIQKDVQTLGGTIEIDSQSEGNTFIVNFCFDSQPGRKPSAL